MPQRGYAGGAGDIRKLLEHALKICEEPDGPYMYGDMLESDLENASRLEQTEAFDDQYEAVCGFAWKRPVREKG